MKILKALLIPCLLLTTAGAMAQPQAKSQSSPTATEQHKAAAPEFFRLTFVLKELNGKKVIDSRSYMTEISATTFGRKSSIPWDTHRSIRAGDRVPSSNKPGAQYQYLNIGTDIDCSHPLLIGHRLAMQVTASISGLAKLAQYESSTGPTQLPVHPIFQNNRWNSEVLIPIGQPTVLFTSEDPASTRNMELDVTATPLH